MDNLMLITAEHRGSPWSGDAGQVLPLVPVGSFTLLPTGLSGN